MYSIMEIMNDIKYGWVDKNNDIHINDFDSFSDNYKLQSPKEVLKNKVGICWDQVELERELLKNKNINTYFIVYYDNDKCPTHTFLIYNHNNKYYWFEHSWEKYKGIHEYNDEKDALKDIKDKYIKYELNNNYNSDNLCIYKYDKPKFGISCLEFFKHCESGEKINS